MEHDASILLEEEILKQLEKVCIKRNIKTKQVLAITIQRNRATEFSALIVDFENSKLLPNYPIEMLNDYKELAVGDLLVCSKEGMKVIPLVSQFKES